MVKIHTIQQISMKHRSISIYGNKIYTNLTHSSQIKLVALDLLRVLIFR